MHRYTRLADVFPRPRALPMGGAFVVVGQYTLGDLAQLDDWLLSQSGADVSSVLPALLDPDPQSRRRRLVAAWEAIYDAPTLGGDATSALNGDQGRAMQVLLAAHRAGNEISADQATEYALSVTLEEWIAFDRFVWGVPVWRAIIRELDPESEAEPEPIDGEVKEPHDWGKNVARLVLDCGMPPSEVERLTISQYRLLCRGGEPDWYRGPERRDDESIAEWVARSARVFALSDPLGDQEHEQEDVVKGVDH